MTLISNVQPFLPIKVKKILIASVGIITLFAGVGYWYIFIAGAPQLDAPQTTVSDNQLTFELKTFNSKAMGKVRQYGLILPPGYDQNPKKHYPVIFLLHGGHDDARAWVDKLGILPVLDNLYKTGKLPPSIIITPDGNDNRGSSPLFDPDYFDDPNGKVGTLIGSELVQIVKSHYRTLESPQFWAMGGLSSGGWGAFNIGLRHLNNFNILFSHLGYFTNKGDPANSPNGFVQQLPTDQLKRLRAYMDAGKDDLMTQYFINSSRDFHQTLNQLGVNNVFYAFRGGHGLSGSDYGWNYVNKHAYDSLSYVGEQFKIALAQAKK